MYKIVSIFLSIQIVLLPTFSYAEDETPKAYVLKKGQRAPYDGLLLNKASQIKMVAEKKEAKRLCDLRVEYLTMRGRNDCKLQTDLAKLTVDSLEKKHKEVMKIKDNEIKELQELSLKNNSSAKWWLTGGILIGVAATIATFFVVAKVSEATIK